MTLAKGRLIKGPAGGAQRIAASDAPAPRPARNVHARMASAALAAEAKIAASDARAHAILAAAEETARLIRDHARIEGREQGAADLVAAWMKLRSEEGARDERDLDRTTELARAMAERLLGETLTLDPAAIASIARQALAFARQARRVSIRAHPADADALRGEIGSLGLERAAIEIHVDPTRPRGSLLLDTDLGILDANLTLQLDRLARSIRDSFRT